MPCQVDTRRRQTLPLALVSPRPLQTDFATPRTLLERRVGKDSELDEAVTPDREPTARPYRKHVAVHEMMTTTSDAPRR